MKLIKSTLALLALALPALALPEAPDMETAIAQAQAAKKNIFVDFTGTDWCTACIYLRDKIVESKEFEAALGDKLILIAVDFPRTPALVAAIPDEEKIRREAMLTSYRIEGLPGVALLDENGMPYEVIQGTRRTPKEYIALVKAGFAKRDARDAALAKAEGLTGMARAKALAKALSILPEGCLHKYGALIDEINAADPENTLGYKDKGTAAQKRVEQTQALRFILDGFRGKFKPEELEAGLKKLDQFLATPDLDPEIAQAAWSAKGDSYAFLRDFSRMIECYQTGLDLAPESRAAHKLKSIIDNYKANTAADQKQAEQKKAEEKK